MRVIFEEDIENSDFFEIILTEKEIEKLPLIGVVKDFPGGLSGKRNLNVYIRMGEDEPEEGEEMPLVKGKAAKSREGFSENVKAEMNAGKPQKQAVAIAYSEARAAKKKVTKKGKKK